MLRNALTSLRSILRSLPSSPAARLALLGLATLLVWTQASPAEGRRGSPAQEAASMEELLERANPGPEHARLTALVGEWEVIKTFAAAPSREVLGTGEVRSILGERYIELDYTLGGGEAEGGETCRSLVGFDRRHDHYTIVAMDTQGTYFVTARGVASDGVVALEGQDDEPQMAAMGLEKKFVFELDLSDDSADRFSIAILFVDTRRADEPRLPFARYEFLRR